MPPPLAPRSPPVRPPCAVVLWLWLNHLYPLTNLPRMTTMWIAIIWSLYLIVVRGFHMHREHRLRPKQAQFWAVPRHRRQE